MTMGFDLSPQEPDPVRFAGVGSASFAPGGKAALTVTKSEPEKVRERLEQIARQLRGDEDAATP